MLKITIPAVENYDELNNEFFYSKPTTIQLEHSLVSLSKWESRWRKPFLDKKDKTKEEIIDYIKCMTITQNVDPSVFDRLTNENYEEILDYIKMPMTATTFNMAKEKPSHEVVTSEIIYYWMIANSIPFECQKWHLDRLITLIKVCSIKNSPQKKMSRSSTLSQNASLNAARRKARGTSG